MKNYKSSVALISFLLMFLLSSNSLAKSDSRVLYIASYHPGFPTFSEQVSGIRDIFSDKDITLDIEFMDTKRFPEKENWDNFTKSLTYKLSKVPKYDAIMVADDNALIYGLQQQDSLFANTPIVFLGVNNVERAKIQNSNSQITGVVEAISMKETIDLMISQKPDIKTISVIVDGSTSGQGDLETFYSLQKQYENYKFSEINLSTLSWIEFKIELRRVSNKNAILLLSAYKDKSGKTRPFEEGMEIITRNLSAPLYHLYKHGIGDGVLGGKVISHYNQGKVAAELVLKIVSGVAINDIPVVETSPNQFLFDYEMLKKHHISANLVPTESIVINTPYSFYEENKQIIWGVITTISILSLALVFAFVNILKRRRVEKELSLREEQFKLLTANLPSVMLYQLVMNQDGSRSMNYVSENVKEINGVSVNAVLADTDILYRQILPEYREELAVKENVAMEEMKTFDMEAEVMLPNGEIKWFLFTSTPTQQTDGTVVWDGAQIDITERKKVAVELHKLRNYLSNIIDSMPSILICVDMNGEVTQWNLTAQEETGLTTAEVLGKNVSEIFPELEDYMGKIQKSIRSNTVFAEQKRARTTKKGDRYEDLTIYPLIANGVQGAVIRIDDVTKEYNLGLELTHSRKMDAIGQLAGGVAHDFNNMLAGILGAAQILKSPDQKLSEENLVYIEMILNAAARSADLTKKLLAFGRKGKALSTEIDAHEIIDNTLSIVKQTIDRKIVVTADKKAKFNYIIGDNSALQNSLMNLCINASHAMVNGGDLTISTRNIYFDKRYCDASIFSLEPGEYLEVEVRDSGCGIPVESINSIFEPFYTTKEEGEGTGLGLAAVYGTVLDHHGSIIVSSEPELGTVFHLYFPCVGSQKKQSISAPQALNGTGLILLVDDEDIIRLTCKHLLEDMGYTVLTARDGKEGISIFKKSHTEISLVIMDMIMPEMNGSEAYFEMKEIDSECKVILSSGFTKDENMTDLLKSGLAGFITKPFTNHELSKLMSSVLSS